MDLETVSALLKDFLSTDHLAEGWSDPNEHYVWDVLSCELYFKGREWRCRYPCGQEYGDYKIRLSYYADNFEEFKTKVQEVAEEIVRIADGRALETILISDRMDDGDTDYFEWER
jgi:hypothetical protein